MTASGQVPPPAWDPFNVLLAPEVDVHAFVAFIPPDAPPGIVGITLRTASGELTVLATKAKARAFADALARALDSVPDPSGLIVPGGTPDGNGFARPLRFPGGTS